MSKPPPMAAWGCAITCSWDGSVLIYDCFSEVDPQPEAYGPDDRFTAHPCDCNILSTNEDGDRLLTGGDDRKVKVWSLGRSAVASPVATCTSSFSYQGNVRALKFSPDEQQFAVGTSNGVVAITNIPQDGDTSTDTISAPDFPNRTVYDLQYFPDGNRILTGSDAGRLSVFDLESKTEVLNMNTELGVMAVLVTSDENVVLASGRRNVVKVFDVRAGEPVAFFEKHRTVVRSLAETVEGDAIISASWDKQIYMWDLRQLEVTREFHRKDFDDSHSNDVEVVCPTPDGKYLLSGGRDNVTRLWDISTGEHLRTMTGHTRSVVSVSTVPHSILSTP
eukprot:m.295706 g.295706  ORF g.295706 m.295706 type:complete len:334 (+) comp19516_c1_seq8:3553-4554(+)